MEREPDQEREPGLEERLGRLEEIVRTLESGEEPLDRAMTLFREGVEHIRSAEKLLSQAELQVEELLGDGEAPETRPMDSPPGASG